MTGGRVDGAVLVVGESVLDVVTAADGSVYEYPGGSPANVAVGLARLGRGVTFLTELGGDHAGELLMSHLVEAGVETVCAPSGIRTPLAHVVLGPDGAAQYTFDIEWTLGGDLQLPDDENAPAHVHTGSIATHLEPGAGAVEELVRGLRMRASVSYDPNVRADLVGARADVVDRTEWFVEHADVVKVSDEDLAWLYPGTEPREAAHRWASRGPSLIVVTQGAAGSFAFRGDDVLVVVPAVRAAVVDTVGAGDAFMAALVDGLGRAGLTGAGAGTRLQAAQRSTVRDVLERSARAAAITVERAGAQPPTAEELDAARGRKRTPVR